MFCRLKSATRATVVVVTAACLSACSSYIPHAFEARGVPVKTIKPSAEDVAAAEKARQQQEKDIAAMASVTGNHAFTERRGTPEYLLGDLAYCPECNGKHLQKNTDIMDVWSNGRKTTSNRPTGTDA